MFGTVGQTIDRALEPVYGIFHRYGLIIGKEKSDRSLALISVVVLANLYLVNHLFSVVSEEKQKLNPGICLVERFEVGPEKILADPWSPKLAGVAAYLITFSFLKNLNTSQIKNKFLNMLCVSMMASFSGAMVWQTAEKAIETRSYENINTLPFVGAVLSGFLCNWLGKRENIGEQFKLLSGSFILGMIATHGVKQLASSFFTELTNCLHLLDIESIRTQTLSSPLIKGICVLQSTFMPVIPFLLASFLQKIFLSKPVEEAENITQKEAVKRTFTQIMLSGGVITSMFLDNTLRPFLEKNGLRKSAPTLLPSLLPLFLAAVLIRAAASRPDIFSGPGNHKETTLKALFLSTAFHIMPAFQKIEDPLLQQGANFIKWSAVSLGVIYTTSLCFKIARVTQELWKRGPRM